MNYLRYAKFLNIRQNFDKLIFYKFFIKIYFSLAASINFFKFIQSCSKIPSFMVIVNFSNVFLQTIKRV